MLQPCEILPLSVKCKAHFVSLGQDIDYYSNNVIFKIQTFNHK